MPPKPEKTVISARSTGKVITRVTANSDNASSSRITTSAARVAGRIAVSTDNVYRHIEILQECFIKYNTKLGYDGIEIVRKLEVKYHEMTLKYFNSLISEIQDDSSTEENKLNKSDIEELFRYLDANQTGHVSFISLFDLIQVMCILYRNLFE